MGKRRIRKAPILIGLLVVLAVANLAVLFLWPDLLADHFRPDRVELPPPVSRGEGASALQVPPGDRQFDGHGIFNPLEGVTARDVDGSDLTGRIAVTYVSGKRLEEKTICYTVFDSQGTRLEDRRRLELPGYTGPAISVDPLGTVTWEELQQFPGLLVERGQLRGTDGFGNDAAGLVACSYALDPQAGTGELTFSLYNGFQDYTTARLLVRIENLPLDHEEF